MSGVLPVTAWEWKQTHIWRYRRKSQPVPFPKGSGLTKPAIGIGILLALALGCSALATWASCVPALHAGALLIQCYLW